MCGELGYNVQKLKRIRIMNIELGNLPVGQYRKVTDSELKELMRKIRKLPGVMDVYRMNN